jgi:Peptidase propeptide and YPEB domain
LMNIITNALGSQIKVSLSNATTTAESSVGNNSHAVAAHLGDENEYLVYTIFVIDPNMNFHTVIVDPGNGQVLSSKQISKEEHLMMHKGMMMGPGMMGPGMMGPGMMG